MDREKVALFWLFLFFLALSAFLNYRLRMSQESVKALNSQLEALQGAVVQRDKDLRAAEEKYRCQTEALNELRKSNPDFYNMPLPDDFCRVFRQGKNN